MRVFELMFDQKKLDGRGREDNNNNNNKYKNISLEIMNMKML